MRNSSRPLTQGMAQTLGTHKTMCMVPDFAESSKLWQKSVVTTLTLSPLSLHTSKSTITVFMSSAAQNGTWNTRPFSINPGARTAPHSSQGASSTPETRTPGQNGVRRSVRQFTASPEQSHMVTFPLQATAFWGIPGSFLLPFSCVLVLEETIWPEKL